MAMSGTLAHGSSNAFPTQASPAVKSPHATTTPTASATARTVVDIVGLVPATASISGTPLATPIQATGSARIPRMALDTARTCTTRTVRRTSAGFQSRPTRSASTASGFATMATSETTAPGTLSAFQQQGGPVAGEGAEGLARAAR